MDTVGNKRAGCRLCFCCLFVGKCTADELASASRRLPVAYAHAQKSETQSSSIISGRVIIIMGSGSVYSIVGCSSKKICYHPAVGYWS